MAVAREGQLVDLDLTDTLYRLLYLDHDRDLDQETRTLAETHGEIVYSELIYLLSHLRFPAPEAGQRWREILEHRDRLQQPLGHPVDLRVAFVSHFVQGNRALNNPKVIELKLFEQTQASAYRDGLTGLHNYRHFAESLDQEILRSDRHGGPVSLLMIDVDDFKHFNDRHGHQAGNTVLMDIARILTSAVRKLDIVTRYGGEAFSVILPLTTKLDALDVAERARKAVEAYAFPQETPRLTVSIGIATYPADAANVEELIGHAERALYVAKSWGRNQTQLYQRDRRSFNRITVALQGKAKMLARRGHEVETLQLSEGGASFLCARNAEPGSLVHLDLELPELARSLEVCGRVVRVEKSGDGPHEIAVRFIDVPSNERALLREFVRQISANFLECRS